MSEERDIHWWMKAGSRQVWLVRENDGSHPVWRIEDAGGPTLTGLFTSQDAALEYCKARNWRVEHV